MQDVPKMKGLPARLVSIAREKCPRCGKGDVFERKKNFFAVAEMKHQCEVCGYKFDREPGYFLGAMYVSYGLAVLEGLITFFGLYYLFPNLATIWLPIGIMVVIFLFARKNFKWSRLIYMHIFPW